MSSNALKLLDCFEEWASSMLVENYIGKWNTGTVKEWLRNRMAMPITRGGGPRSRPLVARGCSGVGIGRRVSRRPSPHLTAHMAAVPHAAERPTGVHTLDTISTCEHVQL